MTFNLVKSKIDKKKPLTTMQHNPTKTHQCQQGHNFQKKNKIQSYSFKSKINTQKCHRIKL